MQRFLPAATVAGRGWFAALTTARRRLCPPASLSSPLRLHARTTTDHFNGAASFSVTSSLVASGAPTGENSHIKLGTQFERDTIATLRRLRFNLTRTGGANDGGVDFMGSWDLPPLSTGTNAVNGDDGVSNDAVNRISVIGQCKHTSRPVGVDVVRDFDGAMAAFRASTTHVVRGDDDDGRCGGAADVPEQQQQQQQQQQQSDTQVLPHANAQKDDNGGCGTVVLVGIIATSSSFTKNARRHSSLLADPQLLVTLGGVLPMRDGGTVDDDDVNGVFVGVDAEDDSQSRRRLVRSVVPNRAFLRAFPNAGFTLIEDNDAFGAAAGLSYSWQRPALWLRSGELVVT